MPLPGFFQSLGTMFARPVRPRQYNFDAVHSSLFDSRPMTTPCDPQPPGQHFRAFTRAIAPSVLKRSEQLSLSTADMPALAIDSNQSVADIAGQLSRSKRSRDSRWTHPASTSEQMNSVVEFQIEPY